MTVHGWSEAEIDELSAEWRLATTVLQEIEEYADWLEEDLVGRSLDLLATLARGASRRRD
jgi:hypothetical protein